MFRLKYAFIKSDIPYQSYNGKFVLVEYCKFNHKDAFEAI